MGVACPHLSDDPSYIMVESSGGGSCRCACQDEFQDSQDQPTGCCSPHVFTSILLGVLSCVLMTGGVFLAFHRWDPMWLMVSGVGVVLILIGTILHCCNNISQQPKRHSGSGKGCCSRPIPPDHNGHIMTNNGSLTEQLLPLSNARSVSQLSLNMLPGYFPPVVTAYGIEQHSAVVQNINRIVQQQQQQQQQPQNLGSCSPGVASTAGKSFILLSLPGDATAANIQNLVATVYQLDGNPTESTTNETNPNVASPVTIVNSNSPMPLVLKNAEVQTCNIWPIATTSASEASTSGESSVIRSPSEETHGQMNIQPIPTMNCGTTQTDDIAPTCENINLMDCSADITPLCDTSPNTCDSQSTNHSALVNIPSSPSTVLLDVPVPIVTAAVASESSSSVLVDIPEPPTDNLIPSTSVLVDVVVGSSNSAADRREVLVDISLSRDVNCNNTTLLIESLTNNDIHQVEITGEHSNSSHIATNENLIELPLDVPENTNSMLGNLNPELLSSSSNLSAVDTDIDDGELLERSSPPPSYEDVTLEGENVGAFGLAYGTI